MLSACCRNSTWIGGIISNGKQIATNCTDITWKGRADCACCVFRIDGRFQSIPLIDIESALGHIDSYCLAPSSTLFSAGDEANVIYTIRRGLLKLVHYLPNGRYRIVRLLRPGDLAGLSALVGKTYRHSAIVMYQAEVCRIPVSAVLHLSKSHPVVYEALMEHWQKSLEDAETVSSELSTGSAEARVARLLLLLDGPTNGQPLPHITRDDMGALLAITPETTSRVMADFRRRGLVTLVSPEAYGYNRDGLLVVARDD